MHVFSKSCCPAQRSHAGRCSAERPAGQRRSTIARFVIRPPAELIPTELELKDPETLHQAAEEARKQPRAAASAKDGGAAEAASKASRVEDLGVLAGNLLMNAASWRVVRGQTYCVHCRGTGRETCSQCQGAGIVESETVRMNQLRHAASRVQLLLGFNDRRMHDGDWMKSNRCKRCHGSGAVPCKHCNGAGVRGPPESSGQAQ